METAAEKSIASMPVILEKIAVLDKWLTGRMEQTRAAEGRIEQKLTQLTRLESSLSTMLDGLRKQMADAGPIIQQVSQAPASLREQAKAAVDDVIADALAQARQQANRVAHAAVESIEQQVASRIEAGLASMSVEQMAGVSADVQGRLADEATRCRERAEQTLLIFRQTLAQQVDRVADEARHATQPHLARVTETRSAVDREIDAILTAAAETVRQRLDGLAVSARSAVELIERQLVDRVRTIRPQVMTEVEGAQRLIAHRVAGLIEASRKMVAGVVNELDARLDELAPKTDAVREQLDLKLTDYFNEMERSANTMLGWLEDRITARADDLVEDTRRSMHGQIRALDEAKQHLLRPRPASPMSAMQPSGEPLSMTTYLNRREPTGTGAV